MPNEKKFLEGFNLVKGKVFGDFELMDVKSTHQVIKRYEEYYYNIILVFKGRGNIGSLLISLSHETRGNKIIYSEYGNPYLCTIDAPIQSDIILDGNRTIVKLHGHSYRQR